MYDSTQVLMRKGKRGAAGYILADCAGGGSPQQLGPLLDVLLNPSKAIDDWETIDWCRWLVAGGKTPDDFANLVRSYDKHDKCGLVWIPRVVAYRCRTCGISPCMSICRECFHRGDHATHDFNMFLSQAGGACDCGDNSVMKEEGFCSNHRNKDRPSSAPAADLMCVAEAMTPRLILRLLQHFRENSCGAVTNSDSYRKAVSECEDYVQMLMEFNKMGDLMRSAMTKALINPQMYRKLVEPPFPETEYGCYMAESKSMYEKAIDSFPAPDPPEEFAHLPALAPRLQHKTLLDEFIFWTFKFEFPQNIVCFLLNMLPDQEYKEHLTRTFVLHYARIPRVLEAAADPDTLSNRVVHMSVQLFSNERLALRCVQQLHLLHVMVLSLRLMMGKILIRCTLHDPQRNFHHVIDCTQRVMKEHCYWPLVSDFNNVLSHRSVALLFLQDDALVAMWFEFLAMLQGMNVNVRETGGHIEFEPSSYYAAFSCELEAAAYPMWSVLGHLAAPEHAPLARRIVGAALAALHEWLEAVHPARAAAAAAEHAARASFHFPLHRHLAAFLCALLRPGGEVRAHDLLPPHDLLQLLAIHPLRVQALFYEILAGVWVRNGLQIKGQAMTYIQANFCNSMVDMDIYWLQICAAHLPPDTFLDMCIDMFGVREWLSMSPMSPAQAAEQDAMVEGLFTFLAILVSSRTNLGNDELTQSRLEVSTLLAAGDRTHSQLLELMPERSGNAHTRNFETVLQEVSAYRPPPTGSEALEQGLFVPRALVWERYYDPLHVLRRIVHRREFHTSMDRFTKFVREKQKTEGVTGAPAGAGAGAGAAPLWPPLRLAPAPAAPMPDPRALCDSGVLHAACLAVLHRGVHRRTGAHAGSAHEAQPHAPLDHVLALAVFLLRVGAERAAERAQHRTLDVCVPGAHAEHGGVRGVPLLHALPGALCDNVTRLVASVPRPAPPHPPDHHVYPTHHDSDESDAEWEGAGPAAAAGAGLPRPTSTALVIPHQMPVARQDSSADSASSAGGDTPLRALEEAAGAPPGQALALLPPSPRGGGGGELGRAEWSVSLRGDSPERDAAAPALPPPPDLEADAHAGTQMQLRTEVGGGCGGGACSGGACSGGGGGGGAAADSVPVNESIISLLLKLHSQLSGRLDSFSLDEPLPPGDEPIGDGTLFIGRVLHRLAALDARCASCVSHVRRTLWPQQRERQQEQRARERREREERSRRAKERQQQLMDEFARRQKQFMSAMEQTEEPMEWEDEEVEKHDDCVICNTTSPRCEDEPIGLVVLMQSTSVLGHRRRAETGDARLALSEAERSRLTAQHDTAAAQHHYRVRDDLQRHFDQKSWLLSVSVGWEGGVHLQSCGHRLHLRCLRAYQRSLAAPTRPHNLHVERGEFLCPVCRQLANSVLPLAPAPRRGSLASPAASAASPSHEELARDVLRMLESEPPPLPPPTRLSEAMGKAMEDMTGTAGDKLKQLYGGSPAAIFTFVASLARTGLECELVQRGGSLRAHPPPRYKPRNDCIVPLLVVVGWHLRVLRSAAPGCGAAHVWRALHPHLAADPAPAPAASPPVPAPRADEQPPVPLLLQDPLALLMQLLLLAPAHPPHLDIQHFTCIVRALYTLTYYQIVCQFCAATTAEGRAALAAAGGGDGADGAGLGAAAARLLGALAGSELFTEDGPPRPGGAAGPEPDLSALEEQLAALLLPLLRVSALLRHHLYGGELPAVAGAGAGEREEHACLARYLQLPAPAAAGAAGAAAAPHWARQLAHCAAGGQLVVRRLLRSLHARWLQPALLALPRDYDRLFTYYHERVCQQCGSVPKEASVCLLCGTLVCLKQACCRQEAVCEAVQHAAECGGGTGIFLVVTSTYIIVIRGARACLWGSLYLDDYDEEDRDLKRGKPLYLSQDRLELLQAQWLAHRFDHTKRTWVWHRDSL